MKVALHLTYLRAMRQKDYIFMVPWTIFKNHLLEVGWPYIEPSEHDTPNAENR